MVKTVKMCYYYLGRTADADAIWEEAQQNDCQIEFGKGKPIITMWETNPYNSLFALKYSKDFVWVRTEDWVL